MNDFNSWANDFINKTGHIPPGGNQWSVGNDLLSAGADVMSNNGNKSHSETVSHRRNVKQWLCNLSTTFLQRVKQMNFHIKKHCWQEIGKRLRIAWQWISQHLKPSDRETGKHS